MAFLDRLVPQDTPVEAIRDPVLERAGVQLSVLRLDRIHPQISGNKWFKLIRNLERARAEGHETLLSFGGPWSNHLHALARAGQICGLRTIGIVRGELPSPLNACLSDARAAGMTLVGMSRADYARKSEPDIIASLHARFGRFYLIPEGGANREGLLGCADIPERYDQDSFDLVCMACGTGTMLAGMALTSRLPLVGVQVLKGAGYLVREVDDYFSRYGLAPQVPWRILEDWHHGGYARVTNELLRFLTEFEADHGIPLEPVYSGKLLYAIYEAAKKRDIFPHNSRILAVHGGGLQGLRGFV